MHFWNCKNLQNNHDRSCESYTRLTKASEKTAYKIGCNAASPVDSQAASATFMSTLPCHNYLTLGVLSVSCLNVQEVTVSLVF